MRNLELIRKMSPEFDWTIEDMDIVMEDFNMDKDKSYCPSCENIYDYEELEYSNDSTYYSDGVQIEYGELIGCKCGETNLQDVDFETWLKVNI